MTRIKIGLAAVVLLVAAVVLYARGQGGSAGGGLAGACMKVGLVFGALWLALPQIERFIKGAPKWLLAASVAALVVCIFAPWLLLIVVPALAALWFFVPKFAAKFAPKAKGTPVAKVEKPPPPAKRPRRRSNA
jgi:hypothetical protein